ncbi:MULTISPECIES: SSI family serine proteinase inhibitor [unclassified Nocardiopsis]|uniref:SSI family serine proteinase inhibitor n=1 Tax=Nocardiopsis TaxID=2013 RepID=UPI00387B2999
MKRLAACGLALLTALALTPGTASAERHAPSRYVLSVTQGEVADTEHAATTTLECSPTGGDHPRADEACRAIAEAGSIEAIAPGDGACLMLYDPVTVTVTGDEEFERTYGNSCQLALAKGPVFDFSSAGEH